MMKRNVFFYTLLISLIVPAFSQILPPRLEEFEYTDNEGYVTITKYNGNYKIVNIPDVIHKNPVTAIGDYAFFGKQLTNVTLPASVTAIGDYAFFGNRLSNVNLPETVSNIGNFAFTGNLLSNVTLPDNVEIKPSSFTYVSLYDKYIKNKKKMSTFTISLMTYDDFEIAVLDNSVVEILKYNGNSTTVRIPERINNMFVTAIGAWAFSDNELTSVTLPNSVTIIGNGAFQGNELTSLVLPNSVTNIGDSAFACNRLTSVTLPNSVTAIGAWAFSGNLLTGITLPNSLTVLEAGILQNNRLSSVTLPNSVVSIGDYAFAYNRLTSLNLPNSVVSIGEYAFLENWLPRITLPNSVISIGDFAFFGNQLTSVTLPDNVEIKHFSFYYTSLYEKYINNSMEKSTFSILLSTYLDFEIAVLDNSVTEILSYIGNATSIIVPPLINGIPVKDTRNSFFLTNIRTQPAD